MTVRRSGRLFAFAFVGWALCAATMGIGMATTSVANAMLIHAVLAPLIFIAVSIPYFRGADTAPPWLTAVTFVAFVVIVDFALVALVILRSLDMFTSPLGTWIPFALIFLATYVTGQITKRGSAKGAARAV